MDDGTREAGKLTNGVQDQKVAATHSLKGEELASSICQAGYCNSQRAFTCIGSRVVTVMKYK